MAGIAKVKITVLRKLDTGDIREKYSNLGGPCERFKVGDEFIAELPTVPQGFCSVAWADINQWVMHLAFNGDFFHMKEKGTVIACCTDGLRPVVFKLERIED